MMSVEAGRTGGSINPGPESTKFQDVPHWEHNNYQTPFGALAEILQRWPGSTQTSEQTEEERHLRLVLTIAGYPEILVGRRPLDIPLHDRSELALKLSLFLDKIRFDTPINWHSLRTYLLHYDLLNHKNMNKKEFLHELIIGIRTHSTFGENREKLCLQTSLHPEEIRFLTVLHSHDESRLPLWPLDSNNLFKATPINCNNRDKGIQINILEGRNTYFEHEFRLDEIHKWIHDWTSPKQKDLLNQNISQQWLIGASSILESVFAKLRSHILDERRPGAIIIDGGGRVRYISKETREFENNWFSEKIYSVFLQNITHPHPFANLITSKIASYAKKDENGIVYKTIRQNSPHENGKKYWRKDEKTGDYHLTGDLYELLIGESSSKWFLPEVVVDPTKPRKNDEENISNDRERYLLKRSPNRSWIFGKCGYCNNEKITAEGVEKPEDLIHQGIFVCPFHYLLSTWGKSVTRRQTSNPELFSKQPFIFKENEKSLKHIICFDGNSIGLNFTREFTDYKPPKQVASKDIWDKQMRSILDIETPWQYPIKIPELERLEERKRHSSSKNELYNLRLQVLIRKQRRSFSFNAEWWLALRKAIVESEDCTLIPWIMAGDDMVLVNKSNSTLESILNMLKKFHENISLYNENITLAGSIQIRDGEGNETTGECFDKAYSLEKTGKLVWKKLAVENFSQLLDDEKHQELNKNWTKKKENEEMYEWINSDIARKFRFGPSDGPVSIIIPSDWKNHSSS